MKREIFRPGRLLLESLPYAAVGTALGGWEYFTKTPLTMRTALTLAGLTGVFSVVGVLRRAYEETIVENAAPEKEKKRIFVADPAVVLELAKLTGYEAIRRLTPYRGKWMTISGAYEGMAESLQRDSIHLSLLMNDGRRMNLRFALTQGERLRELKEGQRIAAICQIPNYGVALVPENCELLRAEPLRRAERTGLVFVS